MSTGPWLQPPSTTSVAAASFKAHTCLRSPPQQEQLSQPIAEASHFPLELYVQYVVPTLCDNRFSPAPCSRIDAVVNVKCLTEVSDTGMLGASVFIWELPPSTS